MEARNATVYALGAGTPQWRDYRAFRLPDFITAEQRRAHGMWPDSGGERRGNMKGILRAAIIGTGRIRSTYDDEVPDPKPATFYRRPRRHNRLYTVLPINHAPCSGLPEYRLMAGANRGEAKLRAFGERYGVRRLHDFRAMLREEQPDVVSVCTQSPEKAEITVEAAQSGVRAIVVEKAMATSMAEADAMVRACEENGVLLAVNHPNRFSLANREVCRRIAEGEIGEVGTGHGPVGVGMLHGATISFDSGASGGRRGGDRGPCAGL